MSGHSKWATTKRKKAAVDAKRGKIFTKHGKLITIAARDGKSGDPAINPSLRVAVDNAKAVSMPKENIERAIKHGIGGAGGVQIEEVQYEVYAPGGIAMIVECLTDNKNRTIADIKAILNKTGGSLASSGSVLFQFKKIGQILIDESKNDLRGEELEMAIIDSDADNFEKEENIYVLTTNFANMHRVKKNLEESSVVIESAEFVQIATNLVTLEDNKKKITLDLIEKLEDLDDISNVFTNLNL